MRCSLLRVAKDRRDVMVDLVVEGATRARDQSPQY